jgi:hypothetical protein
MAAPALAKGGDHTLAGGGGGVCYTELPALGDGWVAVADSCFSPYDIAVQTGDEVRWSLVGKASHTVTFEEGPDSGPLSGDNFAIRFNQPGSYPYACSFHPGMAGTVQVVGEAVGGPALEVLPTVATSAGQAERTSVLRDSVPMRVEFSPLTAIVVLAVGLPLSLGAALRLVGVARSPAGYRLRRPWARAEDAPTSSTRR